MENKKKIQIVSTAKELFWKFGIKRITIEEICKEAKVSKMTFYKHFKNKDALLLHIMKVMTNKAMKDYREIMDSEMPFAEKLEKTIDLKMKSNEDMSEEFFKDFYSNSNTELLAYFQQINQDNIKMILNDYIKAQKTGDVRQDINPQFIIYFLNHVQTMAKDENLLNMYSTPQKLIKELVSFFFYGILSRNAKT